MAKTYTIEVPTLVEVAFLKALLQTRTDQIIEDMQGVVRKRLEESFPGGIEGAKKLGDEIGLVSVYSQLDRILSREGVTKSSAPWLKPQAPTEIDGNEVQYDKNGIKVGCKSVSLDEMREMVKKCEAAG